MEKKRTTFSKYFKRRTLIDVATGKNFEDILHDFGIDVEDALKKDRKYCAKLIHKWRQEIYHNNELLYFANSNSSNNELKEEIVSMDDYGEKDAVLSDMKIKIRDGVKTYKKLKNRVSTACKNKSKKIRKKF